MIRPLGCLLLVLAFVASVSAVDHRVETLAEPAPTDELSAEIAATLAPHGLRVLRGASATLCDIWLCKELPVKEGFEPTPALLYPFAPGQLMGVIRFARKASDFRDQDIASGVYTLRYGLQPVDGAHEGTSLTRDFLLLVRAEADRSPETPDFKALTTQSAEAIGASHPGILSLQRVTEDTPRPSMRHDEERDWWIVGFEIKTKEGKSLPAEVVIAGVAAE